MVMLSPISTAVESKLFHQLVDAGAGKMEQGVQSIKPISNTAAIREFVKGVAVMDKDWNKPILFPESGGHHCRFKWLGWADNPQNINSKELWKSVYKKEPELILGAVGNSNIMPEYVKGGSSLSQTELSNLYEKSIKDFFTPIFRYFEQLGVKFENIGFVFSHRDSGADKAVREIIETNKINGIAAAPTAYAKDVRTYVELDATRTFPNGAIAADFQYPTILTRNSEQIKNYAELYSKLIGNGNPIGLFGGIDRAFVNNSGELNITQNGAKLVPIDIMKDSHGIVILPTNDEGILTNAARNILDNIKESPYHQYKADFISELPFNSLKSDIAQYDPQMAMATIAYKRLNNAGMIPKN